MCSLSLSLDKIPSQVLKYLMSPEKPLMLGKDCIWGTKVNYFKIFKWDGNAECSKEEEK